MSGADLVTRATIEAIVARRDRALELFGRAFDAIEAADAAVRAAHAEVAEACGGRTPASHLGGTAPEVEAFRHAVQLPDPEQYRRVARRLTDAQIWAALVERTEMDHLMDKQAKDQLRAQMAYIPEKVDRYTGKLINAAEIAKGLPPVTVEAVEATLRGLLEDAGTIFARGVANAFARLDRRFRSHDGFSIGARIILSGAFDQFGSWSHYRNQRDDLIDVERVFLVLDGRAPRAAYGGIVGEIEAARKAQGISWGRLERTDVEGEFFRVRIFKNGNAHLWFTRKDLVAKVNRVLADYYGEVLGEGRGGDREPDPLEQKALTPARRWGFFPTPPKLVEKVLEHVPLWIHADGAPLRILEPSAGTGCLSAPLAEIQIDDRGRRTWRHHVEVVEVQPELARALEARGTYARVWARDFLAMPQQPRFDVVVMNPPFDRQRDIDHAAHAWGFLKPGGKLVAIMSAGAEFRENAKARAFRELVGGRWQDLPAGSFAEQGTNVNTCLLVAQKR